MVHLGEFLKTWSMRSNSVTRQVSFLWTKIGGKCQNSKNWNCSNIVSFSLEGDDLERVSGSKCVKREISSREFTNHKITVSIVRQQSRRCFSSLIFFWLQVCMQTKPIKDKYKGTYGNSTFLDELSIRTINLAISTHYSKS